MTQGKGLLEDCRPSCKLTLPKFELMPFHIRAAKWCICNFLIRNLLQCDLMTTFRCRYQKQSTLFCFEILKLRFGLGKSNKQE